MRSLLSLIAALWSALGVTGMTRATVPSPAAQASSPPHVLVIVEENREYNEVIGDSSAPYVNQLAQQHGLATQSYAQSHPSLPNYLELLSGSTWGIADDGTGYVLPGPTLVDQLSAAGIGWRAYMESMPSPCYSGAGSGDYAKKHDPFMYFTSITSNPVACGQVVPYAQAASDLAGNSAPPFLWVTPNLCDDGHDCSTATMDAWLANNLPQFLNSAWFHQNGIAFITWDEGVSSAGCCGGAAGGHIATLVVTENGGAVSSSAPVDHAGLLRTIETIYRLPYLHDAACGCSGDLFSLIPPPSAHVSSLSATQTNTDFTVSWALDPGSTPAAGFQLWVNADRRGWLPWTGVTSAASTTFNGIAGHQYAFAVQAVPLGRTATTPPGAVQTSTTVAASATHSEPFTALYAVDGFGMLHPGSSPPLYGTPLWNGWDIARGLVLDTTARGGVELDGWGGLHPFGDASTAHATAYWYRWDIARAITTQGDAGYVLDGFGGLHGFGMNGAAPAPPPRGNATWNGWDIARSVAEFSDGSGGVVLDGFGGVHPFGVVGAARLPAPIGRLTGYWQDWDIARSVVLLPGSTAARYSGYVLDGWGGLHAFASSGAALPPPLSGAYWRGLDVARVVVLLPRSSTAGYTVDALGGFHPFGGAPAVTTPDYAAYAAVHGGAIG